MFALSFKLDDGQACLGMSSFVFLQTLAYFWFLFLLSLSLILSLINISLKFSISVSFLVHKCANIRVMSHEVYRDHFLQLLSLLYMIAKVHFIVCMLVYVFQLTVSFLVEYAAV